MLFPGQEDSGQRLMLDKRTVKEGDEPARNFNSVTTWVDTIIANHAMQWNLRALNALHMMGNGISCAFVYLPDRDRVPDLKDDWVHQALVEANEDNVIGEEMHMVIASQYIDTID